MARIANASAFDQLAWTPQLAEGFLFSVGILLHPRLRYSSHLLVLGAGKYVEGFEAVTFAQVTDRHFGHATGIPDLNRKTSARCCCKQWM